MARTRLNGRKRSSAIPNGEAHEPLSIALNLTFLVEESAGAGRYARELVRAILRVEPETRITAFVGSRAPRCPWGNDIAERVDVVRIPLPGTGFPPWHLVAQLGALPVIAARRRVDVIHGLANLIPPLSLTPTVVTILDVTWIHFPATMRRRATLARRLLVPVCARAADRVIAISEAAKRDLVRTLRLDSSKIDVTALGVRRQQRRGAPPPDELRQKFGLGPGPIALSVAQKREHKNLANLIRGLAVAGVPDVQLVLPGAPTAHESELGALAAAVGISQRVHFLPWLPDADLDDLYGLASCFVLPSFAEGFGLPILEAMSHGLPVACSNVSSMPEVAGDAALYFDPSSAEQIGRAIQRLVCDRALADELRRRGYERCDIFSWDETARRTLATYRRAIAGSSRKLASPARGARGSAASPGAGLDDVSLDGLLHGTAGPKPGAYYSQDRADLVAHLPQPLGKVLDVGCGEGGVANGLRAAGATRLTGIELDPRAARVAEAKYDEIIVGDAEVVLPSVAGPFDTILCYDVLEHLRDPANVLKGLYRAASDHGRLHVSVPNARHYSLLSDLLFRGTFGYTEWGHRDTTHLRWFTHHDIVSLLESCGWFVQRVSHPALSRPSEALDRLTRGQSTEFIVGQWYVLASAQQA